jgi:hypothetical protein
MIVALVFATVIAAPAPEVQYKQPQVAVGQRTTAITFGSGNAIYVATSSDGGRSFGRPVKVTEPGVISLGRHRGPRIALTSNGIVVSAIAGAKGRGADGDVLAWRSTDGGNTWSEGVRANDTPGSAREGLHAMSARGQTVFAAWLDLRSKGTKIFGSVSRDGGATWSKNVLVYESPDGSVCECCHPSATIDAQGHVYVMFRNSLAGSRDLYLARSLDGGQSFSPATKLGSATWQLNACPMDGGGLAITAKGVPVTVWRRGKEVFTASDDRSEKKLGTGKDPALAVNGKGMYAAWTTDAGVQVTIPGQNEPVLLDNEGGYVQLAATPEGKVLAVWERNGSIVVESID